MRKVLTHQKTKDGGYTLRYHDFKVATVAQDHRGRWRWETVRARPSYYEPRNFDPITLATPEQKKLGFESAEAAKADAIATLTPCFAILPQDNPSISVHLADYTKPDEQYQSMLIGRVGESVVTAYHRLQHNLMSIYGFQSNTHTTPNPSFTDRDYPKYQELQKTLNQKASEALAAAGWNPCQGKDLYQIYGWYAPLQFFKAFADNEYRHAH